MVGPLITWTKPDSHLPLLRKNRAYLKFGFQPIQDIPMSKEKSAKKETKKKAQHTQKEKRAAKQVKKASKSVSEL